MNRKYFLPLTKYLQQIEKYTKLKKEKRKKKKEKKQNIERVYAKISPALFVNEKYFPVEGKQQQKARCVHRIRQEQYN